MGDLDDPPNNSVNRPVILLPVEAAGGAGRGGRGGGDDSIGRGGMCNDP